MQSGEYIVDRMLPDAIRAACERQDITCSSFSDDWVLRLTKGQKTKWVLGYKFDINPAGASAVAQDKVAAYLNLTAEEIPVVPHVLARSLPHEVVQAETLARQLPSGPVVVKPLDGTGGRGVRKCSTVTAATAYIQESPEAAWAVSPWLDISSEVRIIVLDGEIVLAYEKQRPVTLHGLKFYNLGLGAVAEDIAAQDLPDVAAMARAACRAFGLRLAAVDLVCTQDGVWQILEVNDGIMMENYAGQSTDHKNRALALYDAIVVNMFA